MGSSCSPYRDICNSSKCGHGGHPRITVVDANVL